MNTFIVYIDHPSVRGKLAKFGKVGSPRSLHKVIVMKTNHPMETIEAIEGVLMVEAEKKDTPSAVQPRPDNWFLPSASDTVPDYTYEKTGKGVAIYVMDSGIRFDHIDFEGRDTETVYSYDGLEFGGDVDGPDHGTMAASCAAGNLHGIAKEASIYNVRYNWTNIEGVKALDAMYTHYMENSKPAILSMSFGSYSNIYDQIFNELAASGVVLVAAAGNYDDPFAMFPARRSDVIAVAACDQDLKPSVWGGGQATNYGPEVDIWAGGTGGTAAGIEGRTDVQWAGGTSSACPLISGNLALILEDSEKLENYRDVLNTKSILLSHSRKDVINYFDDKYAGTANRYIYTLGTITEPNPDEQPIPEPEPTPNPEKKSNNLVPILGAIAVIALIALLAM